MGNLCNGPSDDNPKNENQKDIWILDEFDPTNNNDDLVEGVDFIPPPHKGKDKKKQARA